MMNGGDVCFGNINPGDVSSRLFYTFMRLYSHDAENKRYLGGYVILKAGGLVSIYRNKVVHAFLEDKQCNWLWFVDSDIVLQDHTLDQMMEHADPDECPILAALYFMELSEGPVPSILKRKKYFDGTIKVGPIFGPRDYPEDQLLTVDAVGMGCTLIHRKVLEAMRDEYGNTECAFALEYDGDILCGEDVTFCLRAAKLGFPSRIHTGIEVGHEKTWVLTSETVR